MVKSKESLPDTFNWYIRSLVTTAPSLLLPMRSPVLLIHHRIMCSAQRTQGMSALLDFNTDSFDVEKGGT